MLGFAVTNRGLVGEDGVELAFLSQDPTQHHQIAMVQGALTSPSDFVMVDPGIHAKDWSRVRVDLNTQQILRRDRVTAHRFEGLPVSQLIPSC